MYVAVKGGEAAIASAHRLLAEDRRGDPTVPELTLEQITSQLALAVDRVMGEGSCYDPGLAALAIKQARGDLLEAVFLLRAYRTTLPRLGVSRPIDTAAMTLRRRISATFKDLPGGQVLGADVRLHAPAARLRARHGQRAAAAAPVAPALDRVASEPAPRVIELLDHEGLIEPEVADADRRAVADVTREPLAFPAGRDARLQNLARGDEGFLLALGYSTQRGYGRNHPFAGEIRMGEVAVELIPEELGFAVTIAEITVTECQMVNQFKGSAMAPPQFTRGYGLAFGSAERKAMTMALVDRALRGRELGEEATSPAAGRGVRALPQRQRGGLGLRAAPEASAPRRLPVRAGAHPHAPRRGGDDPAGGRMSEYNFAFLDEQSKRMIRRAILKAVAIPGYQVPFGSREMPLSYGWGTGGVQVTASVIGPDRRPQGHRSGRRRHDQRRQHPPVLRPHHRRTHDRAHRRGDADPDPPSHSRDAAVGRPDPRPAGADPRAAALARAPRDRDPADARARRVRRDVGASLRGHHALGTRRDRLRLSRSW